MTTRADLIETAVRACLIGTDEEESLAETLGFDENYARAVVVPTVLDAVLPQITTAEQLRRLRLGATTLDASGNVYRKGEGGDYCWQEVTDRSQPWWLGEHVIPRGGPLTVVWQPQPGQETRADA